MLLKNNLTKWVNNIDRKKRDTEEALPYPSLFCSVGAVLVLFLISHCFFGHSWGNSCYYRLCQSDILPKFLEDGTALVAAPFLFAITGNTVKCCGGLCDKIILNSAPLFLINLQSAFKTFCQGDLLDRSLPVYNIYLCAFKNVTFIEILFLKSCAFKICKKHLPVEGEFLIKIILFHH